MAVKREASTFRNEIRFTLHKHRIVLRRSAGVTGEALANTVAMHSGKTYLDFDEAAEDFVWPVEAYPAGISTTTSDCGSAS